MTVGLEQGARVSPAIPEATAASDRDAPGPDDAALQRAIVGVQGIAAAAVHRDPDTGRTRLRLRLQAGEDRERVAWAVAAVLRERFGIALDPAAITPVASSEPGSLPTSTPPPPPTIAAGGDGSAPDQPVPAAVAAPASSAASAPPATAAGSRRDRITITRLDLDHEQRQLRATVGLAGPAGRAEGTVQAVQTTRGKSRALAEATVQALVQLLSTPVDVGIDGVDLDHRSDPPRVTVALTLLAGRGEEPLLGVAAVRDDLERAVVRATLDALNRRVEPLVATAGAAGSQR